MPKTINPFDNTGEPADFDTLPHLLQGFYITLQSYGVNPTERLLDDLGGVVDYHEVWLDNPPPACSLFHPRKKSPSCQHRKEVRMKRSLRCLLGLHNLKHIPYDSPVPPFTLPMWQCERCGIVKYKLSGGEK